MLHNDLDCRKKYYMKNCATKEQLITFAKSILEAEELF